MPLGRPPKRPGEPDVESPDNPTNFKMARIERSGSSSGPNDFSSVVKNKLQSYTRTGQACDRCKVRKIRCDALPEGCSHCLHQNLECFVTDRVTGRTERRGYVQELEREKMDMLNHIRTLEKLLEEKGVEVHPWQWPPLAPSVFAPRYESSGQGQGQLIPVSTHKDWKQVGNSVWVRNTRSSSSCSSSTAKTTTTDTTSARPSFLPRPAESSTGVAGDRAPLSSIMGTTLSILGSTIDLGGTYEDPDVNELEPGSRAPLYNKSVRAMLQSTMNINPPLHVDYPPRTEAFTYAEWYFLTLHPFLPVLHKPSFMTLLKRVYDDITFKPTMPETVMVHMVLAIIYLQYGVRNQQDRDQKQRLIDLSNKHYHFALSKFYDLNISRTLEGVQAMTLVVVHARGFLKPDCCVTLGWHCIGVAISLGLHRSSRQPSKGTNLENEIRKRVWWIIVCLITNLNGRTGRPMPIQLKDIDQEFPESIADECLTNDGVDTACQNPCAFEPGITAMKWAALMLEVYAHIYCVNKNPHEYAAKLEELEERALVWRHETTERFKDSDGNMNPIQPVFAEYMYLEFRLRLRHPSSTISDDPRLIAENKRISEQVAKQLLVNCYKQFKFKSLDITCHAMSVIVAAIFTELAALWERRQEATVEEVDSLREDMSKWLEILNEISTLTNCGSNPVESVSSIIDRTLTWIEHDHQRTSENATPGGPIPPPQDVGKQLPPYSAYSTPTLNNHPAINSSVPTHVDASAPDRPTSVPAMPPRSDYYSEPTAESAPYPSLSYNNPPAQPDNNVSYEGQEQYLYSQGQVSLSNSNSLSAFATQATEMAQPNLGWRQQGPNSNTWQEWTAAVVDSQDRYSANALMSLGGGAPRSSSIVHEAGGGGGVPASSDMSIGVAGSSSAAVAPPHASMQWPLLLFGEGANLGLGNTR